MWALLLAGVGAGVAAACGCRTIDLSGRRQFVMIPESQEIALGVQAYQQMLADEPPCRDEQIVEIVNRVGRRLAAVANKPEYDWEFRVIGRDTTNAFALPGGKVAIYEGILPVCQDEAGLAVVISHEVAHALARHGGERLSQQAAVSGVGGVIGVVSRKETDQATAEQILQVYGALSEYGVILPYSRMHESEADAIGLILMAKAGYDPSAAPEFWARFARLAGNNTPELLSTHPADARRAADLRALLPEAMNYYRAAPVQLGLGESLPVGRHQQSFTVAPEGPRVASPNRLSLLPRASAQATTGRPESSPGRAGARSGTGAASNPDRDPFRLPQVSNPSSPAEGGPFGSSASPNAPLDDGWQEATGRAVIP